MSKIDDTNYFQVNGFMVNRLKLKGVSLMVYAIIYGFTQDGESYFNGSRQYLCDFTNATKPTIDKALEELANSNLIIKKTETINSITFNRYKVNLDFTNFTTSKETLPPIKKLDGGSKETLPPSKETLPNNIENNIKDNIDNNIKDNKKFLKEKEIIEPQEEIKDIKAEPMALTTEVVEPKNEIAKQDDINFDEILNHWNSLDIIRHKKMTLKTQKKIRDLIKNDGFTIQDILIFMDRYNVTLKDEHYFFKYKWSLEEFITREKGVKEFKDDSGKWLNYLNSPSGKRFEEQETFSNLDMSDWLGGNRNVR